MPRTVLAVAAAATILSTTLVSAGTAAAYAPQLTRFPYLTDVVGSAATVSWATDRSQTSARVRYGREGVEPCTARSATAARTSITVNGVPEYQWRAQLQGLLPGAAYCYRVELGSEPSTVDLLGADASPSFSAQLPAGATAPFSFAVLGDFGAAGTTQAGIDNRQADLMAQLATSGVRFAVGTGDTAYPSGSQTNYGDLRQTGSDVSTIFAPEFWAKVGGSIPFFNAVGNHGFNSTFISIWPQATAASSTGERYVAETYCCVNGTDSAVYPSAWYAFDAGNTRFYVLEAAWTSKNDGTADEYENDYDAHWAPGTPQYEWLANDLSTHPSQLKFAFFHFPMYSSNATEGSDPWLRGSGSLEGLLARNGVDIGFSGHAHNYTRNLKPSSDSLVTYVTGGGGARLQPATRCGAPVAYADRLVVHDGRQRVRHAPADLDRPGVPLPEGERGRLQGHRRADRLEGPRPSTSGPTSSAAARPRPRLPRLLRHASRWSARRQPGAPTPAQTLSVPIASEAGHALVASIAVQAGTTTSVAVGHRFGGECVDEGPGRPPGRLEHADRDLALARGPRPSLR